jgi:hypothetical protein
MSSSDDALAVYLNDHLAGSSAGSDLAREIQSRTEGTELGSAMVEVARQIEEDRETLVGIMRSLGIEPSGFKEAAGTVLEKLSRIKFHPAVEGSEELNRLLQLETLGLGITGKRALWQALDVASATNSRLAGFDFRQLIERANGQLERVEPYRLELARTVLGAG